MTKHNLNVHLTWLVGSSTFVPPPPGPTLQSLDVALPFSSGSEDPLNEVHAPVIDLRIAGRSIGHDVGNPRPLSASAINQLPANTSTGEASENMARLQSGPKVNNRSKLLSQGSLQVFRTPKQNLSRPWSSSLRDQYSAPYEKGWLGDLDC